MPPAGVTHGRRSRRTRRHAGGPPETGGGERGGGHISHQRAPDESSLHQPLPRSSLQPPLTAIQAAASSKPRVQNEWPATPENGLGDTRSSVLASLSVSSPLAVGRRQPSRPPAGSLVQSVVAFAQVPMPFQSGVCSHTRPVSLSSAALSPMTHVKRVELQPLPSPLLELRIWCQDGAMSASDFIVEPTGPGGSSEPPSATPRASTRQTARRCRAPSSRTARAAS